jgi:hypothetical protein
MHTKITYWWHSSGHYIVWTRSWVSTIQRNVLPQSRMWRRYVPLKRWYLTHLELPQFLFTDGRKGKLRGWVSCLPDHYRHDNRNAMLLKLRRHKICPAFQLLGLLNNSNLYHQRSCEYVMLKPNPNNTVHMQSHKHSYGTPHERT